MKWTIKVMFETTNHSFDGRLQGKPMDLDGIPKKAIWLHINMAPNFCTHAWHNPFLNLAPPPSSQFCQGGNCRLGWVKLCSLWLLGQGPCYCVYECIICNLHRMRIFTNPIHPHFCCTSIIMDYHSSTDIDPHLHTTRMSWTHSNI